MNFYIYCLRKLGQNYFNKEMEVFSQILKTDILKDYPIPIADKESLWFFDNQVKPIFNKILKNQTQIRTLTALRDTLLPKLMSGEVRVQGN
jgi:type I restriction enzyme, S subunit